MRAYLSHLSFVLLLRFHKKGNLRLSIHFINQNQPCVEGTANEMKRRPRARDLTAQSAIDTQQASTERREREEPTKRT